MWGEAVMGSAVYKTILKEPVWSACEGGSTRSKGVDESVFNRAKEKQMTNYSDV